ncbi:FadR/GntR family transcriptional regulator [Streptomyces sp. NPDC005548]|uniref:FadR/GntR family transcriptional regulator n=1 Tax=Streptomyces sp. NPDC005548 TaxID=3364724 RepID=UPI0036D024FD
MTAREDRGRTTARDAADDRTDPPALRRADWTPAAGRPRAELAADLVAGLAAEVAPGSRLGTKDELRARCGVSVGTFNETLRLLSARGVVTSRPGPGGGLFVAEQAPVTRLANALLALDASAADVTEALRIRNALEPLLWRDALWHASPADIAHLRDLLTPMQSAADSADVDAFVRANWRLHAQVADITPHTLLRSLYIHLLAFVEQHALDVEPRPGIPLDEHIRDRCRLHAALVDTLDKRDEAQLMHLLSEHDTGRGDRAQGSVR